MVRISRVGKIRLVAGIAVGRRASITAGVAGSTTDLNMGAGKREGCCRVIELRRLPGNDRMTQLAVVGEPIRFMRRIGGRSEIGAVAGVAIRIRVRISRSMAVLAGDALVTSG